MEKVGLFASFTLMTTGLRATINLNLNQWTRSHPDRIIIILRDNTPIFYKTPIFFSFFDLFMN